jgi:selenocysteine lyase/cysteine desulfurase
MMGGGPEAASRAGDRPLPAWSDLTLANRDPIPLLGGREGPYINLDFASTAPPLLPVREAVDRILEEYGSVGRGGGWRSDLCTETFERARLLASRFVGADHPDRVTIFTKQATDAINLVASQLPLHKADVVLCTRAEHHANLLPWRCAAERTGAEIRMIDVDAATGRIRRETLAAALQQHRGRLRIVAVTGASNVTGILPDVHGIAKEVHAAGARLLVDGAQWVPHRTVDVRPPDDPACIDFLALSGHKMYAPFGAGVLVAPRDCLEACGPYQVGGGAAAWVAEDHVDWKGLPGQQETGSPNLPGVVALAAAADTLQRIGMDAVADHERALTRHVLRRLADMEGVTLYGPRSLDDADRLGVFTFNVRGMHHRLVSAILSYEYGIATRSGAFCAHPYVTALVSGSEDPTRGDGRPGAVRASLGLSTTREDLDALLHGLERIAEGQCSDDYVFDPQTKGFRPRNWPYRLDDGFPPRWVRQ